MSTVNNSDLLLKLQSLLAIEYFSVSASDDVDDVLASALSTNVLNEINIIQVDSVDSLPNLTYYDSPSGMIYYVNNIGVFALSSGNKWLTLDGRLLRQDDVFGVSLSWGSNANGRLGDNTAVSKSSPVLVAGGFTNWCQVSGGDHSVGVRTNGTLWAWGCNASGQLGDNTIVSKSSPVSVVGGFTNWCQASAGSAHSLGVRTNGTAWAWGGNGNGRLGDNTAVNNSSPVLVAGGFTDWCQASAGQAHSLGVRTNGTLWAWGNNSYGRLGDNTTVDKSSPVSVVGGFTDWCQVSIIGNHSLGVRCNGTAWAWGLNNFGQLGDNTIVSKSSPVSVVGGFTNWCQASAGSAHSLGVRTNGTAWAWGGNGNGRLGDNTAVNNSSPVLVAGGFTDWCQASAGNFHSLGVRTNGTLWAWGLNSSGQLGDNTITDKSSPVSVVGGSTDWCQASAGGVHSLGVRTKC